MLNGTILRKIRERCKFTQEEMSHLLNISQSCYHKIESDKVKKLDYQFILNLMENIPLDKDELKEILPENLTLYIENNHTTNTTNGVNINQENNDLWQALLKSKEAELETERKLITEYEAEIQKLNKELLLLREENSYLQKEGKQQLSEVLYAR